MKHYHIPLRQCVGCRQLKEKPGLFRVIKTSGKEILLDPVHKLNGRGAYICKNPKCIASAKQKRGLERALKTQVPDEIYETLVKELDDI